MLALLQNFQDFMRKPQTQFEIPIYQRNYDWREPHCDQLFDDIKDIANDDSRVSHFIGSIVYISDSVYHSADLKRLVVIDGQQRLTTLTLFLLAIAKRYGEIGNSKRKEEVLEDYIINKRIENEKLKLRPVTKDDAALHHLLHNLSGEGFAEYSRIIHNFNYLFDRIKEYDIELLLRGFSKLFFVEISLERGKDDPQRIFESLNSTGLDLSQGDLIRNYVLMDLPPEEQKKIYFEYWLKIETNTKDLRTNQPRISDFIRDYLTFKLREIPKKSNVFDEFKKKFHVSNESIENRRQLTADLLKYSSYYSRLLNPEKEASREIQARLKQILKVEVNVSYPFLLEVYDDYCSEVIDESTFISVLDVLISYVWRRFICQLPSNALNKLFMYLYKDIDKTNYIDSFERALVKKSGKVRFPTDNELKQGLLTRDCYNTESKNRIYFLERLENFNNNEPVQIEGNEQITIEHIFPQKPGRDWESSLGDDFGKFKDQYLHTITNLTLSGNNADLGNKGFVDKRDLPEKGYKDSRLYLNKSLASLNKWTSKEYSERFEQIYNRFLEIWKFPEIQFQADGEGEADIMTVDVATNKNIDFVIFDGIRHESLTWMSLLRLVAKSMFELDAQRFLIEPLQAKMKTTTDKNSLTDAVELGGGYFIEGQGNANMRLRKIQNILSTFEFDDEVMIKFKSSAT